MTTSVVFEQSRLVPVTVEHAWGVLLPVPLEEVFSRRFAAIAPVVSVRDQVGAWGTPGQSRVIVLADGGTMREELLCVRRPEFFEYRMSSITGPLRPLVRAATGRWSLAPVGTGVRVRWAWTVEPSSGAAGLVMPVFKWMWRGYARQALERLEGLLLAS